MKSLLILALALLGIVPGQRFRTGVDAVRVDVLVTQGRHPVTGLSAADFVRVMSVQRVTRQGLDGLRSTVVPSHWRKG